MIFESTPTTTGRIKCNLRLAEFFRNIGWRETAKHYAIRAMQQMENRTNGTPPRK